MLLTPELEEIGQRIRITSNRVLIKPLPFVHPVLLTPSIEVQKGVVIAIGPGWRQRKLVEFRQSMNTSVMGADGKEAQFTSHSAQERTLYFEDGPETGRVTPMQVAVGDVVEFGFRNIEIVDFDRIAEFYSLQVGSLLFVRQKAIYCVDPDGSLDKCLLWQQSAGHDRHGNWMSGAEDWARG